MRPLCPEGGTGGQNVSDEDLSQQDQDGAGGLAYMLCPAAMVALSGAEVPPLQVIMGSETDRTGL